MTVNCPRAFQNEPVSSYVALFSDWKGHSLNTDLEQVHNLVPNPFDFCIFNRNSVLVLEMLKHFA